MDTEKKGTTYRVALKGISKSFGGIAALSEVNLQLRGGEIHALMGENGAGKSTLMKILSGAYQKDDGRIEINGRAVQIKSTHDSKALGIGIIYQEFSLVPELSVAENIFLGHLNKQGAWIRWKTMKAAAADLIEKIGFDISPSAQVKKLSIAEQQVVEIAKALAVDVKVLVLDEPSAVLGPHEVQKLFVILRRLRSQGVAIVYISHRLEEIFTLADRITVLKSGRSSESLRTQDTDREAVIQQMLGRPLDAFFPARTAEIGATRFQVTGLSLAEKVEGIDLSVRSGEVVGIAGLVGSGRTETLQGIFSARKRTRGQMWLSGKAVDPRSPHQAVALGIGMVPEDRKKQGLIPALPVGDNISLTNLKAISGRMGFIRRKAERQKVDGLLRTLKVKARDAGVRANTLSGGNQQKVVLAKWLNRDCEVLLIDEPTRGVDVGAKVEIYHQMNRMAEAGLAMLVVSSETAELLGICDRIIVMRQGRVEGVLEKPAFSEENLLRLVLGETATSVQ